MSIPFIKTIRAGIWKVIGADPRQEYYVDLTGPREKMLGYAASLADHYTRVSRKEKPAGEKGSLLGDYLEFGCYQGNSFIHAYKVASKLMPWMKFRAFDSFEGLPQIEGADKGGSFWKGQFACSEKDFMENLRKADLDLGRVHCVPGWFNETLTPALKKADGLTVASIVYIDCDLYASCAPVLGFLTDIIETGTTIIFDDWFSFKGDPAEGVQRACGEWLKANPDIVLRDWLTFGAYGKSFIVNISK